MLVPCLKNEYCYSYFPRSLIWRTDFSLGLILIIDNINNISSLMSTTNRFSGPHIPMTKMLEKLLVDNFFEENSRLYSFSFSKIKLCHCFFEEFCHSSVLSVQKTTTCSKALLQTFKII